MATKKIGITYEENIDKIDEIIEKLENSELSLDESITEYEKAIKLIKESEKLCWCIESRPGKPRNQEKAWRYGRNRCHSASDGHNLSVTG